MSEILIAGNESQISRMTTIVSIFNYEIDTATGLQSINDIGEERQYKIAIIHADNDEADSVEVVRLLREKDSELVCFVATSQLKIAFLKQFASFNIRAFLLINEEDEKIQETLADSLGIDLKPEEEDIEEVIQTTSADLHIPFRALVVTEMEGPGKTQFLNLKKSLERVGIEAHPPSGQNNDKFELLESDMRFGMLIVSLDTLSELEIRTMRKIVYNNPLLTVIALTESRDRASVDKLTDWGVSEVAGSSDSPERIAAIAHGCLHSHHYDVEVVGCIEEALGAALGDCRLSLEPLPPFMRVSSRVLGALTATIAITGSDLMGRIIISGHASFFERVSRDWLGVKPKQKNLVWDACGELVNRLAGEVRKHYLGRGLHSEQTTPTIVEGTGVQIQYGIARPGLVHPFSVNRLNDLLYAEIVIDHKEPDKMEESVESMQNGEMEFF